MVAINVEGVYTDSKPTFSYWLFIRFPGLYWIHKRALHQRGNAAQLLLRRKQGVRRQRWGGWRWGGRGWGGRGEEAGGDEFVASGHCRWHWIWMFGPVLRACNVLSPDKRDFENPGQTLNQPNDVNQFWFVSARWRSMWLEWIRRKCFHLRYAHTRQLFYFRCGTKWAFFSRASQFLRIDLSHAVFQARLVNLIWKCMIDSICRKNTIQFCRFILFF